MKFKKTISVILSTATIINLSYPCLASAKTTAVDMGNSISATKNTEENDLTNNNITTEPKIVTPKDAKTSVKSEEVEKVDHQTLDSRSKQELIDNFILKNAEYFPQSKIKQIYSELKKLSKEDIQALGALSFHKPDNMMLVSIFAGTLGIDRMVIGKVGTGILKLILSAAGLVGGVIWWLVDIFQIGKLTKEQNWKKLKKAIHS